MTEKKRLIQLIKNQLEIEKQVEEDIEKQIEIVHTAAAKLLLTEMKYDAGKHAVILKGILELIENSDTCLWDCKLDSYVDRLLVKKELEKHLAIEQKTLDIVKEEINQTKDEGIKLLLSHIAEDEDRHHGLLKTIISNSYKISD